MDNMEVLADATIEQIEEMALKEAAEAQQADKTAADAGAADAAAEEKQQAVDDGAAAGAEGGDGAKAGDDDAEAVAMKSGKGTIPYAVLKETREELARVKQELAQSKKGTVDTAAAVTLPENHATQVADVTNGLQELGAKFEAGDIDWEEYQSQLNELNTRKEALIREEIKVQVSQQMVTETAFSSWKDTVKGFLANQHDGFDYRSDPQLFNELDTMVKALGSDPANNGKEHQWFLDTAHAVVMVKHGGAKLSIPLSTQQPSKEADVETVQQQGAPFHTLSDLPGGEIPNKEGIEQVAQLSGEALTNRFLNDPSQIDKVLNSLAM